MALEVSAAIIGILAAAGKVAETLGPVVSAFLDAPKHANTILIEVRYTRTILLGLQTLFDELSAVPQRRKQLIQIDQLIAALTDGVLLFSELESLVDGLGDPNDALLSRAKWARKDHELESTLTRLLGFKTSITLMLGILRCESDLVAQYDRQVLLENTAKILKNNVELSQRLAHLESQLDQTRSVITTRTVSVASTSLEQQIPGITATDDATPRVSMQLGDTARVFQFEPVLKASRVYRRAKRDTADYSFCSSIPLSHAWTALSDMSLGDVSIISVIALPVQRADLANADHYEFTDLPLNMQENSVSQRVRSQGSLSTLRQQGPPGARTSNGYPYNLQPRSPPVYSHNRSKQVRVAVIGSPETDVNNLAAQFISPHQSGNPQSIFNEYVKYCCIDGVNTDVVVEAMTASPDAFKAELQGQRFRRTQIFMLVYKGTSRESFDRVEDLIRQVMDHKDSLNDPLMVLVGTLNDESSDRAVPGREGYALAQRHKISYREISESRIEPLNGLFFHVVRQLWASDLQTYRTPSLPPSPTSLPPSPTSFLPSPTSIALPSTIPVFSRSTELHIVVTAAAAVDLSHSVIGDLEATRNLWGKDWNTTNIPLRELRNRYETEWTIDGHSVRLDIELAEALPMGLYSGLNDDHLLNNDMIVVMYETDSRTSFMYMEQVAKEISRHHSNSTKRPMVIFGKHRGGLHGTQVATEGRAVAQDYNAAFVDGEIGALHTAFAELVRLRWDFEMQRHIEQHSVVQVEPRAATRNRRYNFLRRKSEKDQPQTRIAPALDAIQEV